MATHAAKRQRVSTVRPLEDQVGLQIVVILLLKFKGNEPSLLISSSPDCEVLHQNSPSDTDVHSQQTAQQTSASTAALPSEPVCQRTKCSKPPSSKISKTRSLHNFFPTASETQRRDTHKAESFSWTQPRTDKIDISDDTIEDGYDSFDELFSDYIADRKVTPEKRMEAPLAAGERVDQAQAITHTFRSRSFASNRKRFVVSSASESKHHGSYSFGNNYDKDAEKLPWAQKYSPVNLNELAVHKKKIADVQSWLSDVLCAFEKKLLVLRGPAGSGKTTTLSLLSDKLGFDVLEWRNPSGSEFAAKGFTSTAAQFEEFLTRGNRLRGLEFKTGLSASKRNGSDHMRPRLILIEEFPTVFDGDSPSLTAFRLSLQRYLSVSSSPRSNTRNDIERHGSSPVVIIVSETMLNSGASYSDNLTAHRLLGPDILSHPGTTIVDFNAIAPTFMFKALDLVLAKHIRRYRSAKRPGPAILKSLSEIGDIRSAISSLEFLCLRCERFEKYPFPNATRTGRGNTSLAPVEKEALQTITYRESSLGLFHAVGKIVYNKREGLNSTTDNPRPPRPPDHLCHCDRPAVSLVPVNELLEQSGTDTQTFISALYENYIPSCDGPAFVDCINGCIEALSDSDVLSADNMTTPGSSSHARYKAAAGLGVLRQDELSYQVAARGLLFSLPSPVKRRITPKNQNGNAQDGHRIFFPTELRRSKEKNQVEELTNSWKTTLLHSLNGLRRQSTKSLADCYFQAGRQAIVATMVSRNDLLLYQLPYMTRIGFNETVSRELDEITSIPKQRTQCDRQGIDDTLDHEPTTTYRASSVRQPSMPTNGRIYHQHNPPPAVSDREDKFVLSDDDIEDV
ncbi:putative cell cycle checkpoint protein Rad17 [Aspergillus novofumigatus IBT 16806]|uniref:Cell cycle checkpoint protein rad17 n=1 Tax=Aspergillus novofumigatus (strain IBT 16806) TaxID=1392255 RepID=A0A2I1BY07_ASPN1|nr:cell cycle checkpoint protein rad17 [Aspergillus novofumigatus IBT 16806]PKX90253.1 cell cycle checkpoint protein rad17 [Aspergillus novofumigatus IBT 16806]